MSAPAIHTLTLPGKMLRRGFWLYVWRVETPQGSLLYVGRTGDNSSPNATAPYTRMGQHLGKIKTQNALRAHLKKRNIDPEDCDAFHMVAFGPIFPEIEAAEGSDREVLMARHKPWRDIVGAMEKALAEALAESGYSVLNTVRWNHQLDPALWRPVLEAFKEHFPKLGEMSQRSGQ